METVEVTLSPVERRAGVTRVGWTDLAAQQRRRGDQVHVLAPGDDVVLDVGGHTFHRGRVLSYHGTGADGAYVITIGAPMSRHAGRRATTTAEPVVHDVVARVIPIQRDRRVSLYL